VRGNDLGRRRRRDGHERRGDGGAIAQVAHEPHRQVARELRQGRSHRAVADDGQLAVDALGPQRPQRLDGEVGTLLGGQPARDDHRLVPPGRQRHGHADDGVHDPVDGRGERLRHERDPHIFRRSTGQATRRPAGRDRQVK